jgi:hypothetical protein
MPKEQNKRGSESFAVVFRDCGTHTYCNWGLARTCQYRTNRLFYPEYDRLYTHPYSHESIALGSGKKLLPRI